MESASLAATEGPIVLGYLAVAVVLGIAAAIVVLLDDKTRATRRRNRLIRHARAGCALCREELAVARIVEDLARRSALLEAELDRDVDAWLDFPTARNTTA